MEIGIRSPPLAFYLKHWVRDHAHGRGDDREYLDVHVRARAHVDDSIHYATALFFRSGI
jgi:hypothetical protein